MSQIILAMYFKGSCRCEAIVVWQTIQYCNERVTVFFYIAPFNSESDYIIY